VKSADTALFAPIERVHVLPLDVSQPVVQPVKSESIPGAAVRVTAVPATKSLLQPGLLLEPQLMPPGDDVTVPLPMPVSETVNVNRFNMKIAVTVFAFVIDTVHVVPDTESQPVHPVNREFVAGPALRATGESLRNCAEQALPQLTPSGFDVTVPAPSPCLIMVSVSICLTVTVVLPVLPNASVEVIVAVPRPTPVTSPDAPTVATLALLVVHVIPVPCIVTGMSELVLVPIPNSPKSPSPQH
jgi:hypothetical protein